MIEITYLMSVRNNALFATLDKLSLGIQGVVLIHLVKNRKSYKRKNMGEKWMVI